MLFIWMTGSRGEESYGNPNKYWVPSYIALRVAGLKGCASMDDTWITLKLVLKRLFRDCLQLGNLFCTCHCLATGSSHDPPWCLWINTTPSCGFCLLFVFSLCFDWFLNKTCLLQCLFVRFLKSLLQAPFHPVVLGPPCPTLSWDFPGAAGCLSETNAVVFFCGVFHQSHLETC